MNFNRGPIVVKIELESLRQAISVALSQESIDIDNQIKAAIDEFVKEDRLGAMIKAETRAATERAVKQGVLDFFSYGPGGKAIKEAVNERLSKDLAALKEAADEQFGPD